MVKLLIVCGPTATGKTTLAAELAKTFNGELISADSRQVYMGRDLETNKERPNVPIWLYDVVHPGEEFSVSHWVKLARLAIADVRNRKKLPIIVGGTGLYIKALLQPFETMDVPPNKKLREKHLSVQELQKMVVRGDMNDSDWNNPRRLIRRIETAEVKSLQGDSLKALIIGLTASLPVLYRRIDDHVKERIRRGMKEIPSNEHAIARKQLTWFKKQKGIHWFDCTSPTLFSDVVYLVRHATEN